MSWCWCPPRLDFASKARSFIAGGCQATSMFWVFGSTARSNIGSRYSDLPPPDEPGRTSIPHSDFRFVSLTKNFNLPLGVVPSLCFPIHDAMRRTSHFRRAPFLAAALYLCSSPSIFAAQEQQGTIRFVRHPDPAPEFKLSGLDGKPVTLADSRGKVILLNFWATWCGPCRAEIPDLVELQNKYKDRLQILGLVVDEDDQDAIKEFAEKFGINYPVAIAGNDIRFQYGGIAALPTSFVLDAEGRIVQKHEGLRDPVLYETEIRSLLGLSVGNVKVETFEDTGQIFLKNAETCTCGCKYTLAQCRIYDRNCEISKAATSKIVAALAHPAQSKSTPAKSEPAAPPASAPKQKEK